MPREMKVIVSKDGKVTIDVRGIKGSACKSLTQAMEKAIGTVTSDENTDEYYEQEQAVDTSQELGY